MTRLKVQEDRVANVVRLLVGDPDDPTVVELDPERAQHLGHRITNAGESVHQPESKFAGDPDDGQMRFDEVSESDGLLGEKLAQDDEEFPGFGTILNDNDPLDY